MKRLAFAAALAVAVHVAFFRLEVPWTQPLLQMSPNRAVDINLVTFQKPVERAAPVKPAKPRPRRQTQPERPPAPIAKPVVQPRPAFKPAQPEPAPVVAAPQSEPAVEETPQAAPDETGRADREENSAASDEEHAAIQVSVPLYDLNPAPVYPRVARRRNYQGTVLLDVRVTVHGRAAEVKLARSSGYSVLDQRALTAVKGWRFEPARRGSQPVETWVQVPVRFELK